MGNGDDEQALVDLDLLAHFEAQAEERDEREQDLDDDHEERAALVCEDDAELDAALIERLFGARRVA